VKAETTASAASPLAIAVISAEAGGFKKAEVSFTLSAGEAQGIEVHLAVATAAAAVNVTAGRAPLNVDESRIQATLSADTVFPECFQPREPRFVRFNKGFEFLSNAGWLLDSCFPGCIARR